MAGRRTNLALLALLAVAFGTGALAYPLGTGWNRWALIAHAVTGIAILALSPWKSVIAQRGLMRKRPGRRLSIAFSVLVVVTLATGFAHSTGMLVSMGPITSMQVHVGAAIAAVPLAVWHLSSRPTRPRRIDMTRRNLLRAGALLGGAGALYAVFEGALRVVSIPGAERRFTGSHEQGSFEPDRMPITQWLDDSVPEIDPDDWTLTVTRPGSERTFSYQELAEFDDGVRAVLDCTGGWYASQEWAGVRLDRLLGEVLGRSINVRSATGYGRRFPARDIDRMLLATRVGDQPLSAGHGFPARIVAPGRRGFWWVKWVTHIEVDDRPWWLQSPFPLT